MILPAALGLLLALLCACAASPTMDLSGFLQNRKALGAPLDLTCLYRVQSDGGESFYLPCAEGVALRLLTLETGELYECRVLLQKTDASGRTMALKQETLNAFLAECAVTLRAFCGMDKDAAENVLQALSLQEADAHQKAGALTMESGRFHLTFRSHPLESLLCVRNRQLMAVPESDPPESRPLFDDTTATRKETVPHK